MPDGMARRVNTTFYDRKRDLMQWRVEWLFHGPGRRRRRRGRRREKRKTPARRCRYENAKVDETATIGSALRAHFAGSGTPRVCTSSGGLETRRESVSRSGGREGAGGRDRDLPRRRGAARGQPRFHRLALDNATFRENLNGKRVLEFPTLHVAVLPEDEAAFPLVPPGDNS